ncbi:MAG: hypothetical protein E6Q57_09195 [Mycobacterium sp.]|nr:MAG: hypothetical protein E6Q57_09195 [Mycobacterium sp.]
MSLLRERATKVWLGLIVLTVLTTWVLSKDVVSPAVAVTGTFLIAAVKVRFVMLDFMELRGAPVGVRMVFQGWIVIVTALILGFWFLTPGNG